MSCQYKSKLKGRQLQAIKDFNAADVCFSDGANPLSFHIGDHFTFLSYRDKHWANVERTILNNNSILLIETYPPTEQGIIPIDYVIEMDTAITENDSVKTDQNNSDQESLSESQDSEALKAIFVKEDLERQLEATKKRLGEAQKEIKMLSDRSKKEFGKNVQLLHQLLQQYYAASEVLIATKEELEIAQKSIIAHQEMTKKYQDVFEEIKTQIHKSGNKSAIKVLDKILAKEAKQPNGVILQGKQRCPSTGEDDLMLSCTLCSEKIKVSELASHSKICSSQDKGSTKPKLTKQPSTPTPDMLRVNVTYSETDQKNATFKVVTKTTLPNYQFPLYEVHRSEAHFEWLQEALQEALPERIVPPLVKHTSLNGKTREFQRFLSRICSHKALKHDGWLHLFLTGFNEELEAAQAQLDKRKSISDTTEVISDRQGYDENAPVIKCKKYMESLNKHIQELINHIQISTEDKSTDLGVWFKLLSEGEPTDTYLKAACAALSKICHELGNYKETEENLIVSDLTSIAEYVKSAKKLLVRVEQAVGTFLHWDAEVRQCEEMTEPGNDSAEESQSLTQRWAEANSNCAEAKAYLERLCQDLKFELSHFDLRKESELREVLIEYTTLKSEHFEKVQSKWFGVKFMVEAPISSDIRAIKCIEEIDMN
ncbi:uncharacterized protein LOC116303273 isoform X2 [Actinia tenebrosa]|uniref:Uncharacterized protein LOC116303273 isoform X2 n=1 Tax=Actinia tenebrosa TaxID=6105 RepID=A0A6P8IQV9_ACTTE|nr:uncharacterized protein LOC116303273 isoform X2 [Actinia tenebrosa]